VNRPELLPCALIYELLFKFNRQSRVLLSISWYVDVWSAWTRQTVVAPAVISRHVPVTWYHERGTYCSSSVQHAGRQLHCPHFCKIMYKKSLLCTEHLSPKLIGYTQKFCFYPAEDRTHVHYRGELSNGAQGNSRCFLWESCETHKFSLSSKYKLTER
jgi:hypothetical protein